MDDSRSFFEKRKVAVIALVVIALAVSICVPATILVPKRSLEDYRDEGQTVRIEVVERGDETATFMVTSEEKPIVFEAEIKLPDEVVDGSRGYVCTSVGEVLFDGSYEHGYDFLFPREGNLLKSFLTNTGQVNFNLPTWGHIVGDGSSSGEYIYEDADAGFTASFPSKPERDFVSDENIATTAFSSLLCGRSVYLTDVQYMQFPSVPGSLEVEALQEESLSAALAYDLSMLPSASEKEIAFDASQLEFVHGEMQGHLTTTVIASCTVNDTSNGSAVPEHAYGLVVAVDNEVYVLVGVRETYEEAEAALNSFALL